MKTVMDMIARKRPLPGDAAPAGATGAVAQPADPAADPAADWPAAGHPAVDPAAGPAPQPPAAPQIWDLEPAADLPAPPPAPAADPAAEELRRRRGLATAAAAPAAPATGSRARTRVLGFAAAELAPDALSGARAAPAAVARFPAGWIVVVEGPGRGASFTLGAGVSTIGRAPDQTVALDFGDMAISREMHASIAYDDEQNRFFVGHGGKSNIVRRNGAPVLSTEELIDGDILRIGRTSLRFVALCGPGFRWDSAEEDGA